jgi:6-phosphogluconolactonase (cycloisomerase 2 family)
MQVIRRLGALAFATILTLSIATTVPASAAPPTAPQAGAVFTLSNDPAGNTVEVFGRAVDGMLSPAGSVATGGLGSGDGLGSQGSLVLSDDGRWLVAVNAGSDEVSVFAVSGTGIRLTDVESSGGDRPISVTIHGGLVYVLNDGSDTLSGLRVNRAGNLKPLTRSTIGLSASGIDPAQVEFTPSGTLVVVTEKNTNVIDVYRVHANGRLSGPSVQASEGETPFGFAFDPSGRLIVSEAFGGAPDASAMSSYSLSGDGTVTPITASAKTTETAACWVVVTKNGRYTYTTNTGSNSITGYRVAGDGSLTLLDADGKTASTGATPIDMALTQSSRILYALAGGVPEINGFVVNGDGSLEPIGSAGGLPAGTVGLAAS